MNQTNDLAEKATGALRPVFGLLLLPVDRGGGKELQPRLGHHQRPTPAPTV